MTDDMATPRRRLRTGETIAALGVIGSLIFVGLEVRQNTSATEGATLQAISDTHKVKDVPSDTLLAIAPANAVLTPAEYSASLPVSLVRPYLPGDPPPLNVLYCVYLD